MRYKKKTACLLAGLVLAGATDVADANAGEIEEMRAEMQALRKELAEVKALHSSGLSAEQQKQFIDSQIARVKNEALTLAQERSGTDILAGINEKGKIFFKSSDGSFSANLSGQAQFRYIWNGNDARADESLSGFQARRMKLGVKGTVGDSWGYKLVLATSRGTGPGGGNTFTEDAYITYKFDDHWSVLVGTNKLPFARQELVSSSRQVAVDRSLVTEFFTLNRSDQATVIYKTDDVLAHFALSDGGNADFTGFAGDASNDFALTGRAEWQVMGDNWKEATNEFGGVEEDMLFLAGAVHYEVADGSSVPESGLAWTAEALYKTGPLALSAAVFGNHTDNGAAADTDQYGVYAQGSYDLGNGWDAFARWEAIDDDDNAGAGTDPIQAVTFGANRHYNKHVKLTGDVVWIYAGDNPSADGNFINGGELSSGLGLSGTGFSDAEDQIAFRLQLQLLF